MNMCFESFKDLASVLGISDEAVGLNHKLNIAFGARGNGNAVAHYEPGGREGQKPHKQRAAQYGTQGRAPLLQGLFDQKAIATLADAGQDTDSNTPSVKDGTVDQARHQNTAKQHTADGDALR